jgi:pyruvate,water dikinase
MEWRDQVSFLMTEDSYLMRRCVLALGAKLTGLGALREPEDIFYLDLDEIEDCVLDTWKASETPAGLAAARKAELAADAEIEPPETICGECGRPQPPSVPKGTRFLAGIGGSGGVVRGRARIVHDPAIDGRHLGRGDILVVPFTDIGWTPVLAEVGGIVAETGGLLSHSSIIAREFGIPAVVSVRHATVLIGEGQEITVDGKTGRVHLCSDSLFEGGAHER